MSGPVPLLQLCFAVSLITVFIMYLLRAGQYFDPLLYVLLGIAASASVKNVARVTLRQFPHMLPPEVHR
jgi:ABC-type Fe3+-siderophore transport system permease subunit